MHRWVTSSRRLVEAAPVAGALRFELLSEGTWRRAAASVTE